MYDFCFTIPYGLLVLVGGIVAFIRKGSTASLASGTGTGALLLVAGYVSLKAFEKRKNSLCFCINLYHGTKVYANIKKIMSAGTVAALSAIMSCFYIYKIATGGNHMPSKNTNQLPPMHTITPQRYFNFHVHHRRCCHRKCITRAALQAPVVSPPATKLAAEDPELQSTWGHRAWVAAGSSSVLVSLAKAIVGSTESGHFVEPVFAAIAGYVLADLGSGVYHWGIDNYGDTSTPVFGSQIDAFQGHHRWPWTITKRQFANNLHALAKAVMIAVIPIDIVTDDAVVHAFVSLCAGCIMFSQQFHAWSHTTKSRLPPVVVALQDARVLVSRKMHMTHHRPPYNDNYCIVSGVWNELLDRNRVFDAIEMVIFFRFGVRPRSWSEPESSWLEEDGAEPV